MVSSVFKEVWFKYTDIIKLVHTIIDIKTHQYKCVWNYPAIDSEHDLGITTPVLYSTTDPFYSDSPIDYDLTSSNETFGKSFGDIRRLVTRLKVFSVIK